MKAKRIAVIGAGTAGLCSAKHALSYGCQVTVYEQGKQLGGTWVYSDAVGKNEYGIDVHSSMYQGLHTNLPKEIMGFPDFEIPEKINEKSYIPSNDMLKFLNLYAETFEVNKHIKYEHYVIRIRPIEESQWEIIVKDLPNDRLETEIYDSVFVCNGHYHTPAYPNYPGYKIFEGEQIHSHDYRSSEPYKDKTVLVIGAGPSGMDMAYEVSKVAKRVTLSHHLKVPPKTIFPENVTQKPDVVSLTSDGANFIDGSFETFDTILYCTGYQYTFPFLSVDCGIAVDDNYVNPLYKHCMNINHPTMVFIGLPTFVCASQMFDLQARFALKFIAGDKDMPSKEEMMMDMERDMAERWAKGYTKRQAHLMGEDQNKYYADLAETAEIDPIRPVITKIHKISYHRYLDDLINFRKNKFKILDNETFVELKNCYC